MISEEEIEEFESVVKRVHLSRYDRYNGIYLQAMVEAKMWATDMQIVDIYREIFDIKQEIEKIASPPGPGLGVFLFELIGQIALGPLAGHLVEAGIKKFVKSSRSFAEMERSVFDQILKNTSSKGRVGSLRHTSIKQEASLAGLLSGSKLNIVAGIDPVDFGGKGSIRLSQRQFKAMSERIKNLDAKLASMPYVNFMDKTAGFLNDFTALVAPTALKLGGLFKEIKPSQAEMANEIRELAREAGYELYLSFSNTSTRLLGEANNVDKIVNIIKDLMNSKSIEESTKDSYFRDWLMLYRLEEEFFKTEGAGLIDGYNKPKADVRFMLQCVFVLIYFGPAKRLFKWMRDDKTNRLLYTDKTTPWVPPHGQGISRERFESRTFFVEYPRGLFLGIAGLGRDTSFFDGRSLGQFYENKVENATVKNYLRKGELLHGTIYGIHHKRSHDKKIENPPEPIGDAGSRDYNLNEKVAYKIYLLLAGVEDIYKEFEIGAEVSFRKLKRLI